MKKENLECKIGVSQSGERKERYCKIKLFCSATIVYSKRPTRVQLVTFHHLFRCEYDKVMLIR